MKVNLLIDDPSGVRPGYVNVDPLAPSGDPHRVQCDPTDVDRVCVAGECEELLALGVLDYVPLADAGRVLDHWVSRLAHGGEIALSAVDLLEVSRAVCNRVLSVGDANLLLHGGQRKQWEFRKSSYTLGQLAGLLEARGMELVKQRHSEFKAVVVARRP